MNRHGAYLVPEAESTSFGGACVQGSSLEQVLSRVEDAVLMLQGTSYMLAEKGALLHARRRRLPPSARVTSSPLTHVCADHAVTPFHTVPPSCCYRSVHD